MSVPVPPEALVRRHLRVGFGALALFVLLGLLLESLHAWKSPLYLDVGNETRRLVWRLAHAHGTLLAILNLVFALVVDRRPEVGTPLASRGLLASLVLVPFGFFAGGIVVRGGDPGLPVVLVPLGAIALFSALVSAARAVR
ncbi:MAG: hypothetical protein U0235_13330 [Polyangiaceae bacterium]